MSFFGLTQLGVQEPFKVNLLESLDINIFDDEEFEDAFDDIDTDNSGFIDINEFRNMLTKIFRGPPPEKEVARFMKTFDTNQDGKVSKTEFRRVAHKVVHLVPRVLPGLLHQVGMPLFEPLVRPYLVLLVPPVPVPGQPPCIHVARGNAVLHFPGTVQRHMPTLGP